MIPLRLSKEEEELFRKYAQLKHMSVNEMVRNVVLENIEDGFDLHVYEESMFEFHKNPVTYTLEEMKKELGLNEEV